MKIEIIGATLHTPAGTIADCWEDRTTGLLSRAAGLALMPYMLEDERQEAAYERLMDSLEYGDPSLPPHPEPLYTYVVDGEVAFVARQVTRDSDEIVFMGGTPTGRVYVTTMGDTNRLLGIEE